MNSQSVTSVTTRLLSYSHDSATYYFPREKCPAAYKLSLSYTLRARVGKISRKTDSGSAINLSTYEMIIQMTRPTADYSVYTVIRRIQPILDFMSGSKSLNKGFYSSLPPDLKINRFSAVSLPLLAKMFFFSDIFFTIYRRYFSCAYSVSD